MSSNPSEELFRKAAEAEGGMSVSAGARAAHAQAGMRSGVPVIRGFSAVGILVCVALAIPVAYGLGDHRRGPPSPGLPLGETITTPEGDLRVSEEEFQQVVPGAKQEVESRYHTANRLHDWSDVCGYGGILLGAVMGFVAFVFSLGTSGGAPADDLKKIAAQQGQSKILIVLIGLLLACSTLPNAISHRLDSRAARYENSARDLNKVLISTLERIYDPKAAKVEADKALQELREAVARK
jgi:hypothetical protein